MRSTYVAKSPAEIADYLRKLADSEKANVNHGKRTDRAYRNGLVAGLERAAEIVGNTTIEGGR